MLLKLMKSIQTNNQVNLQTRCFSLLLIIVFHLDEVIASSTTTTTTATVSDNNTTTTNDCYYCDYKTNDIEQLKSHIIAHIRDKNYRCLLCNRLYKYRGTIVIVYLFDLNEKANISSS